MSSSAPASRFAAVDLVRVLATLWVAWFHYVGMAFRAMYTGDDPQQWFAEHEAFVQWMLYSGELAIQLFMLLSAFSLTYQALGRERFEFGRWLRARGRRIYPSLWVALVLILAVDLTASWLQTGRPLDGMRLSASDVFWNGIGFTCVRWSAKVSGAWWFIGLILSFYLCFPLFLFFARRGLSLALFAASLLIAVYSREELGTPLMAVFGNPASDFVGSRMMEFSFGVLLAELVHRRRAGGLGVAPTSWPVKLLLLLLAAGALLWFALERPFPPYGPAIAFLVFVALFALFDRLPASVGRASAALAGPSLLFYLLHHRLLGYFVPWFNGVSSFWAIPLFLLFALLLGLVCVALQPLVERLGRLVFRSSPESITG